jgi:hypothetical protein
MFMLQAQVGCTPCDRARRRQDARAILGRSRQSEPPKTHTCLDATKVRGMKGGEKGQRLQPLPLFRPAVKNRPAGALETWVLAIWLVERSNCMFISGMNPYLKLGYEFRYQVVRTTGNHFA